MTIVDKATKLCPKCGEVKACIEFHKNRTKADGLSSNCKSCRQDYYETNKSKIREYRETNKSKIREYLQEYYETNKSKIREYQQEYYETNKDKYREYRQDYYETNKDKYREYRETNKDKILEYQQEYRETMRHGLTRQQRDWLLVAHQERSCPVCLVPIADDEAVLDHDHACCAKKNSCGACARGLIHGICNTVVGAYETKSKNKRHGLSETHPLYALVADYVTRTKERGDWRPQADEAIANGWTPETLDVAA